MDNTTVFSKTGKGLLEVKNRSNRITKEQYRVLSLVDGKANLVDLAERTRSDPTALGQILTQLSDGGYIKVLVTSSGDGGLGTGTNTGSYYVDDLDFTAVLGPSSASRPSIYQSSETEKRQRESAERKAAEAAATKRREEDELRKRKEALRLAEEEAQARKLREDAERKSQLEAQRQAKLEEELKRRLDADSLAKDAAANALRAQAEAKLKADANRQLQEAAQARLRAEEARRKQEEERKGQEELARKRSEEELRRQEAKERMQKAEAERRRTEEENKRKEEEERKRKVEEERRRQEDEARRLKEEQERKRREEEERVRREDEARRKEEERKRREEEERNRKEAEERARLAQEARLKKEEEERRRREEEERKRKADEELARLAEEARRKKEEEDRKRGEEEARRKKDAEERQRRDEEERKQEAERKRSEDEARRKDEERKRAEAERARAEEDARKRQDEEVHRQREKPAPVVEWPSVSSARDGEVPGFPALGFTDSGDEDPLAAILDLPEVIEEPSPVATLTNPSLRSSAGGLTQEDIRRALEEQERRLRAEEEARIALERAEAEAQLKAEREAREAAEAEHKARRDAERRAREEMEQRAREEKERQEIEEQERRKQKEAERRAREHANLEAERRKREEELVRKRKEQEQHELLKAQKDRIQKGASRSQATPFRVFAGGLLALVAVVLLVIQFASLSPWAPDIEKIASQRLGEPVRIGSLHATVFPRVQLILEKVTVGPAQDVRADSVVVVPEIETLFSDTKVLKAVEIRGLTIGTDGLERARGWFKNSAAKLVRVPVIKIKDAALDLPGVALPSIGAQIKLGNDSEVLNISAATMDERLQVEIVPGVSNAEISIKGRNFTMPVGPPLEIMDLEGKGTISGTELRMTRLEYFVFSGQGSAQMSVRWQDGWMLESVFNFQRMSLETAMRALKIQVISDGALDAKGILRFRSPKIETLFQKPQIDASFTARRGNLAGFDIPRALQQRYRDGVQGGKTRFEELTGTLTARDGAYQYRQVVMNAGVLKGSGYADISPAGNVSGRISAELHSSAGTVRGNFTVSGNEQATMLKP
ncbi:MAG: AsmA-like C-terminal region-containing protein [Burkholderiales bacterium]